MSRVKIIGLTGPAGAGKDTVADMLQSIHLMPRISFADPLYRALSAMLDIPVSTLRKRETKELPIEGLGVSPRFLLQTLGTEWAREVVAKDWWVKIAKLHIDKMAPPGFNRPVVITDVRFQNEVDFVRAEGGVIVAIYRKAAQPVAKHASENPDIWSQADWEINNDGSFTDLEYAANEMVEELVE